MSHEIKSRLILGSQSFGRKLVLEQAGYDFETLNPDIDEKAIRSDNYEELPLLIARAKAKALIPKITEPAILITSDQVTVWNGQLREKPESENQAREYLKSYGIHPAQTNTAVVVTNTQTGRQAEGIDIARTFFKRIPSNVIDQLIDEGLVMKASGGFIIEHPLISPYIEKIEGEKSSVTGLPLILTKRLMREVK